MRIRNSRTSFPMLPAPPEIVSRSAHLRSRGPCFDDCFLVEEVNRLIEWSSCPLKKPPDIDIGAQSHDQLQLEIASERKNYVEQKIRKENYRLERPSIGLQESGCGGRTSNFSRTSQREEDISKFSTNIVLALRATAFRPERELPIKKRMYYRLTSRRMEEVEKEKAAVLEVDMDVTIMPEKVDSSDLSGGEKSKSIQCVLNCESFIPSPIIDGLLGQERDEQLFFSVMPIEHEGKPKRRRGRPRKRKGRNAKGMAGMKKSKYVLD